MEKFSKWREGRGGREREEAIFENVKPGKIEKKKLRDARGKTYQP
jgi:hypothetical protein